MIPSFNTKTTSFLALTALTLLLFTSLSSPGAADGAVVPRRSVLGNETVLVLAEERTRRKDLLDHTNYYTGGWNISNEHYFTSVFYTGSTLFLIALAWFVLFGIFLLLSCMYVCCCRRRTYGYSRVAYALSLILLTLFTVAAVVGSIVLYTGQGKFHDSTKDTLEVDQVFLPKDVQNNIDKVNTLVTSAADTLESATENNKDDIFKYLDAVGWILIIVAAVMLTLAFLGFVSRLHVSEIQGYVPYINLLLTSDSQFQNPMLFFIDWSSLVGFSLHSLSSSVAYSNFFKSVNRTASP
ncbi:hypothetical protein SASPL_107993 [Salvia splendens]|uniref:Transmembrane protein n=1 Tax=Salvia splendens TaxID=180675 RepID=A0A8X8YC79_SALSN|nr:hypothetical protein SASPL_107993 [Salvia splendens]